MATSALSVRRFASPVMLERTSSDALEILGDVRAVPVLADAGDDRRAADARLREVRVQVIDVHPDVVADRIRGPLVLRRE
jgi:hypothetical protein